LLLSLYGEELSYLGKVYMYINFHIVLMFVIVVQTVFHWPISYHHQTESWRKLLYDHHFVVLPSTRRQHCHNKSCIRFECLLLYII